MATVAPTTRPVKPRTALAAYAACLRTYAATWQDASGVITGTARELFAPGGIALEFRAAQYTERRIVRRTDGRLTLEKTL